MSAVTCTAAAAVHPFAAWHSCSQWQGSSGAFQRYNSGNKPHCKSSSYSAFGKHLAWACKSVRGAVALISTMPRLPNYRRMLAQTFIWVGSPSPMSLFVTRHLQVPAPRLHSACRSNVSGRRSDWDSDCPLASWFFVSFHFYCPRFAVALHTALVRTRYALHIYDYYYARRCCCERCNGVQLCAQPTI